MRFVSICVLDRNPEDRNWLIRFLRDDAGTAVNFACPQPTERSLRESTGGMFMCCQGFAPIAASNEVVDSSVHSGSSDEIIDVKGDKMKDDVVVNSLNLTYLDLWALALTTSIGGHYLAWSSGLSAGFGTFMVATIVIASGFVCLLCCMAELASALPFAGGAYGIARVTLGIFPGYLVACADTFKSIVTVANIAINVGQMITLASGAGRQYEPLYWLVYYIWAIAVLGYGGRTQWRVIKALAAISVLFLLMYLLGSARFGNLPENAALDADVNTPYEQWFHGGFYEFMHVLPRPCLFFTGIQNINLACREIREPKSEVPKAYMAGLGTGLLTSFATVLVACSLSPGVSYLKTRKHPLSSGYMLMFDITRPESMIISLPATIACGLGFMYFYGQKLRSMGQSRLLNPFLATELPGRHTPIVALLIGSLLGYALCVLERFKPDISIYLYNIAIMGAFATYLSIFLSFWQLRENFPTIARTYVSPLGKAGAVYGFAVFALATAAVCGFQKTQIAVSTFSGLILIATAYYYLVVVKRQVFSEEEKTVMFKAYIVKGNASKASRLKKGTAAGVGAAGAGYRVVGRGARAESPEKKGRALASPVSDARHTETLSTAAAAAHSEGTSLQLEDVSEQRSQCNSGFHSGDAAAALFEKEKDPEGGAQGLHSALPV